MQSIKSNLWLVEINFQIEIVFRTENILSE